jgi:MFS family permease
MCGIFVLSANIPIYLTEVLELSPVDMGIVTSAIGFGGFVGQWGLPAFSDYFGRRPVAVIGFTGGAVLLWFFMQAGADVLTLFALLFASAAFSFGLLSLITGPIATEAAPPGRISTTAGIIIGTGEIFGGGLALVVAGLVIAAYGIPAMLYLALGGLILGGMLMLCLKETAPRLVGVDTVKL